ncbi:MAG TPA: alpha/beta fold hydrolase [Kofleriaceae bacterium]|nr:alpha/beta fold hydrolase [Kofleriaceae bacterium]
MPIVQIAGSPMLPGVEPLEVYVRDVARDAATAAPLLVLHGGWGYEFYPFDAQIAELTERRIVLPDRTGYGKSHRLPVLPPRFHHAAAAEHLATLDALGIERCAIWGHSDGAIIAAIMALHAPDRITAIILEALHLDRRKPRSRAFFEMMIENPEGFGPRVCARLAADHGEDYWRTVLHAGGRAWLDIAADPDDDLYERRLGDLAPPVLVLHGADDPRTEPGELDRVRRELPSAQIHMIAGAGHSPHSERAFGTEATRAGASFLRSLPAANSR